ncbi:MAG: acetate kinase, partial [Bacteroidales bacterium]|nr:acetate kinase [Bacteroidales bacterium]
MKILVLNCGSSSIKYQLIEMRDGASYSLIAKGLVERIGLSTADLTHSVEGKDKVHAAKQISNHEEGVQWV